MKGETKNVQLVPTKRMAKEHELRAKELDQREEALKQQAHKQDQIIQAQDQQLRGIATQIEAAFKQTIRNTQIQCLNWAIDEEIKFSPDALNPEKLINRANELYEALEARIDELTAIKLEAAKVEADRKIAEDKAERERIEKELADNLAKSTPDESGETPK